MKLRVLLVLLVVMVAVAACAAPPELRNPAFLNDSSLVDNQPCAAPCWRGITPGETAWGTALTILEDDATLAELTVESNEETGEVAATFQRRDGTPCCLVYSRNGSTVDQMLLQLAPTNTLGQVIANLGEPTYFSGTEVSPEQAAAALFYPELNLVVYAFVAGTATGEIQSTSEVFAALYLSGNDMQQVLETSNLYDWLGYDSYADYVARDFDVTPIPTLDPSAPAPTADAETDEPAAEATDSEEPTDEPTPEAAATDEG